MNELERQAYLSAFGIENYMPRWRLPFAPDSLPCVMPVMGMNQSEKNEEFIPGFDSPQVAAISTTTANLLENLNSSSVPVTPVDVTSFIKVLEEKKAPVVAPFSLSVWRPIAGMLIIDSRNTTLALPTDLLLNNILRFALGDEGFNLNEEVLRWPMIENRFVSRTDIDARNELQTWLAVENELRPITRLWLLGDNATNYFITADASATENKWKKVPIVGLPGNVQLSALILPSLNDVLKNPLDKAHLWAAIK